MSSRFEPRVPRFDPYGEPVCDDRSPVIVQGDRRARNAAIVVFWTVALLLVAGRIYVSDRSLGESFADAQARIASFVTALL